MEKIDCTPTLQGYKNMLEVLKEVESPSEFQLKCIVELENYIEGVERGR